MEFTGERYLPSVNGEVKYEHLHRYALCLDFVAGKSVLDIASGEGYGSALLAKVAKSVIGVDISSESIQYAKDRYLNYENLSFLVGACELVPVETASIDVVVSFETIEHHDRHEEMMSEIKRVLKKDGIIIISSPNRLTYSDEANYSNPYHVKELYYDELMTLLSTHFSYIKIYGQRMATASFIYPEKNSTETSMKSYTGDADNLAQKVCSLASPIYYIAICSDDESKITSPIDSLYIETHDDLLKILQEDRLRSYTQLKLTEDRFQQSQSELEQYQSQFQKIQKCFQDTIDEIKVIEQSQFQQMQIYFEHTINEIKSVERSQFQQMQEYFQNTIDELKIVGLSQSQQAQSTIERSQIQFQQVQILFEEAVNTIRLMGEQQFSQMQESFDKTLDAIKATEQPQLQQVQSELESSKAQLYQTQKYFENAINEIRSMETSKFWKLRKIWFEFKRLVYISYQTLSDRGINALTLKVQNKIKKHLTSSTNNLELLDSTIFKLEPTHSLLLNTSTQPIVSIVIPVFNQSKYTFNCLYSLQSIGTMIDYEVIVIDDASIDNTAQMLNDITGIKAISNTNNLGFIRSCNRGAAEAKGEFICFLNNDTKILHYWLETLLETIISNPRVGAVGSKLIYPDGRLQEAGGIIWQDASGCNFGRLQDPNNPEYNYVREVDYCSGASLLVRSELFKEIGGFSEEFSPAYYEDTDLCFTIRELGYKVMYQPKSQVIHFEGISSGTDINSGIKQYQQTNAIKFEIKWRETLKKHLPVLTIDRDGARRHLLKPTILIIDSYVPTYDKDAGSCRMYNIIKILKKLEYSIIFLPDNGHRDEPYVSELQNLGVEVIYSIPEMPDMISHLLARLSIIDIAWVCRPDLCEKYLGLLTQNSKIKCIYDTIDLHFLRLKREKELLGESFLQKASWQSVQIQELSIAKSVRSTLVVTETEKDILISLGINNVDVIPTIHECYEGVPPAFDDREGLLFIGGYNHPPNIDAVIWLCNEIMPLVWEHHPELKLTLLGNNPPPEVLNLQQDTRVTVPGFIRNIEPYFLNQRVFVAPLRYGAGMKGKIGQSLSYGMPVVTTTIGAEGFGFIHDRDAAIADDPQNFAKSILTVYNDRDLWQTMSSASLQSVEKYNPAAIEKKLQNLIETLLK